MDYRTMFDNKWLRAWDLGGRDWTLVIRKVEAGEVEDPRRKKKDRLPVVYFQGAIKPLGLNKTNSKTIATLYGNETDNWIGKAVTLYATKTSFGNEDGIDCIRIRPGEPKGKGQTMPVVAPPEPTENEEPVCADAKCGVCPMCIDAAEAEANAQVAS